MANHDRPDIPSLTALRTVLSALASRGIPAVLGGSGLLHALGLIDTVHDWDLVTDAPAEAVADALTAGGLVVDPAPGHPGFASDALLRIRGLEAEVDVLVGFRVRTAGGVVAIPATPGSKWQGVPLARPEDWLLAYRAMGRHERAELLERHLGDRTER